MFPSPFRSALLCVSVVIFLFYNAFTHSLTYSLTHSPLRSPASLAIRKPESVSALSGG
jgi:hypothetical protein